MDNQKEVEVVTNWVSRLILDLCGVPDDVAIKASVDGKGLLIEAFAGPNEIGRLIGKEGKTAKALRELAHNYGGRRNCHVTIRINGVKDEPVATPPVEVPAATE